MNETNRTFDYQRLISRVSQTTDIYGIDGLAEALANTIQNAELSPQQRDYITGCLSTGHNNLNAQKVAYCVAEARSGVYRL